MHYFTDKGPIIDLLHFSAHVGHCQYSYTSHGTAGSSLAIAHSRGNIYKIIIHNQGFLQKNQ